MAQRRRKHYVQNKTSSNSARRADSLHCRQRGDHRGPAVGGGVAMNELQTWQTIAAVTLVMLAVSVLTLAYVVAGGA